mgnify:CR=1 FL=1
MIEKATPALYDHVELVESVMIDDVLIPAGTRGAIVDLLGTPVEAYTVEVDHVRFGEAFLPDLRDYQFKIL